MSSSVLIFLAILFTVNVIALPTNIKQIQSALIQSKGELGSLIVGNTLSKSLKKAYGNETLSLTHMKFVEHDDVLTVNAFTVVWHDQTMEGSMKFWFVDGVLEVAMSFGVHVAPGESFVKLWGYLSKEKAPVGLSWANGVVKIVLEVTSTQNAVQMIGPVNFDHATPFSKATTSLWKGYSGSVSAVFTFPITNSDITLGGDDIKFTWHVPGNHTIFNRLVAYDIVFSAEIYPDISITLNCDLTITDKHGPLSFSAFAGWSEGDPLSLIAILNSPWQKPIGLKWLTISTGTMKVTIGENQNDIDIQGTGVLSWAASEIVSVEINLGGSDLGDVMISITNLPVFGFDDMYSKMTGRSSKALTGINTKSQGIVDFAISNYDGKFPSGLTIEGVATVEHGSEISKAYKLVDPRETNSVFDIKFFSPIFSQNPEYINLDIKMTNPWIVTKGLSVTDFEFQVNINSVTTISANGDFSWKPKHQSTPVTWDASGTYSTGSDQLSLNADLSSDWPDAFGKHYLTIQSASISLTFSPTDIDLSMSGSANFKFTDEEDDVQFSLSAQNNFEDVTLSCTFTKDWTVGYVVSETSGIDIGRLKDFTFDNHVDVGFTLVIGESPSISVTSSGSLLKKGSKTWNDLSKISSDIETITWTLAVTFPLSGADIDNWSISLTFADKIQLRKNLWFEDTVISLSYDQVSLAADFKALLRNNPDLVTFKISGDVGEGDFGFEGEMLGSWVDVFGIRGFTLKNVLCKIEFSAAACADGTCISQFDLGFTTFLGDAVLEFAGGVSTPDLLDSFLIASYQRDLEVSDVCEQWNRIAPKHKINMETVPKGWTMHPVQSEQKVLIEIAAEDGSFGPYNYQAGFHIILELHLIGLHLDIDVGCTFSDLTEDCTFKWDVNMDKKQFEEALRSEFDLMVQERIQNGQPAPELFWSLDDVILNEWQSDKLSMNMNPRWKIDFTLDIFGKHHKHLDFHSPLTILHGNFNQFFKLYIKEIFEQAFEMKSQELLNQ